MIIKLIRHGESIANAGEIPQNSMPDSQISLSQVGIGQARNVGKIIGSDFLSKSLIYTSPYLRTRQTTACILDGSGLCGRYESNHSLRKWYEDPRLREVERGYNKNESLMEEEEKAREQEGWFYYRFAGGESPADCYDRITAFTESMMRQVARKRLSRIVIVSHGLTIRCFIMRWMHLTVEQFNLLRNPKNCDIITITSKNSLKIPQFVNGKYGVIGLNLTPRNNPEIASKTHFLPTTLQ